MAVKKRLSRTWNLHRYGEQALTELWTLPTLRAAASPCLQGFSATASFSCSRKQVRWHPRRRQCSKIYLVHISLRCRELEGRGTDSWPNPFNLAEIITFIVTSYKVNLPFSSFWKQWPGTLPLPKALRSTARPIVNFLRLKSSG